MTKKTLWLAAILWIWAVILTGCGSTEPTEEEINEAKVFCEENKGSINVEDDGTFCMFNDGTYCEATAYKNGDCWPGDIYYEWEDEKYVLPEWAKTSLTNEELEEVIDSHFPKGYEYQAFNYNENKIVDEWTYTYPEDISHTLLIPEHATMASREIKSSAIEDWMIYTFADVTLQDWTVIGVLYINHPVSLDFVASTTLNGNTTTNYQFFY